MTKKLEDTAEGCRSLAQADRARACDMTNNQMRGSLERSADAWAARAKLLERLETNFNARAEAHARDKQQRSSEGRANG